MTIEVFNRYENKYMLNEQTFHKLQHRISDYMEPDDYNKNGETYTITNLYYDTRNSDLIRASLEKPKYKEKLRLRAYGVPDSESEVYAEIKKKVNSLVNKRRSALQLDEAYEFLQTGRMPELRPCHNRQVLGEISYMLEQRKLYPTLYLAYDRCAYFGLGQHDLRVSFDRNIRARRYDLRLEDGDYGELLLDEGLWVMEIKVVNSIPMWLCSLLSENKIYPTSFSKYGTEYRQSQRNQRTWIMYNNCYCPKPAVSLSMAANA